MLCFLVLALTGLVVVPGWANAATPAFSAHKNGSNQTVTQDTDVKLTWSTEGFDTNNNFAADRFTPTVAGKYLIVASAQCVQAGACMPSIYKNGVLVARSRATNVNIGQTPQVTTIVDLNGSTDYVEAFITSAGSVIGGAADRTYFSGVQLDGAGSAASGGNTSMVSGWPDAIVCNVTNPAIGPMAFVAQVMPYMADGDYWYATRAESHSYRLKFNANGSFDSYQNDLVATSDCGVSISALYTAGKAFNFVGGGSSQWTTAGSNIHYNTGNVGIGSATPGVALHVYRPSGNSSMRIDRTAGNFGVLEFTTGASRRWHLGVGNGAESGSNGGSDFFLNRATDAGAYIDTPLIIERSSSHILLNASGTGNVGIGTTNATAPLTIGRSENLSAIFGAPDGGKDILINDVNTAEWRIGTGAYGLNFRNDYDDNGAYDVRMHLSKDGFLGLGTTTPTEHFELSGGMSFHNGGAKVITFSGTPFVDWDNGAYMGEIRFNPVDGIIGFGISSSVTSFAASSSTSNMLMIERNGRVGIGVAPSHILHINGQGRATNAAWATSSDARVKTDIQTIEDGLEMLAKIRPVSFEYTSDYQAGNPALAGLRKGFIAQEVEAVLPSMVTREKETFGKLVVDDFRVLNSSDFTPLLVSAVKQLKAENDDLRAELRETINSQDAEIEELRREVEVLRSAR